jgi:hypothetical protein
MVSVSYMALLFRFSIQKLGLRNRLFSSPGRLSSPLESDLRFLDVVDEPLGAGGSRADVDVDGLVFVVGFLPVGVQAVKEPGVSHGGLLGNDESSANCTGRWSSSPGRVPRTERTARAAWKAAKHARSTAPCVDPLASRSFWASDNASLAFRSSASANPVIGRSRRA